MLEYIYLYLTQHSKLKKKIVFLDPQPRIVTQLPSSFYSAVYQRPIQLEHKMTPSFYKRITVYSEFAPL